MTKEDVINDLKQKGFSNSCAVYHGTKLFDEQFGVNKDKYSAEEKQWAYAHGFTAEEVKHMGINDENHKEYLPSYYYHLLDPIDPFTKRLIDGKLVLPFTIGGRFPNYLPKYYCWIFDKDTIMPMNDNPINHWKSNEDYLKQLVDSERILAIKPYTGAGGIGFVKFEKKRGSYYCNDEPILDFDCFLSIISDKYLVTEYIKQCKEFDEVWPNAASTLRVITINKNQKIRTFVSYVRFGTKESKGACNLTSGGVAAPFDWQTGLFFGKFYRYADYCSDNNCVLDYHPQSKYCLAGKRVPRFDKVKKMVEDLCKFLTINTYFGFDIIITDDDVKICEINSHPSLDYEQFMFGGVWTQDESVQSFFRDLLRKKGISFDD